MMFKGFAIVLAVFSLFFKAESKLFHPKFNEMMLEKSFDESSGQCKYFDSLYGDGQAMIPETDVKCQYICTCHVSEYYAGFLCESLCTQYIDYACSPGWEYKPQEVPVGPPEFGCFCSEYHCVPSLGIEAFRLRLR